MSAPIIVARGLGKTFVTRTQTAASLKEMVVRNKLGRGERIVHRALHDLNFSIEPGHSFAVVGNNGSGKSTLLRLIAGIGLPTEGTLEVRGRVAAMIELGAGFHAELTGMENIFLQGSIVGLSRAQILERLDAIVEFSELERFIHTPIKRYSSGMLVRLGFAIAVHSGAEILLLDEILAVGDGYFQAKCLRAIDRLRDEGRTIFFVSHNLEQVEMVADSVLWLERGAQKKIGPADEVLDELFDLTQQAVMEISRNVTDEHEDSLSRRHSIVVPSMQISARAARLLDVTLLDRDGKPERRFETREPIDVRVRIEVTEPLPEGIELTVSAGSIQGAHVFHVERALPECTEPGRFEIDIALRDLPLLPGRYVLTVSLTRPGRPADWYDLHLRLYTFTLRNPGARLRHYEETLVAPPGAFLPKPR